MTASVEEVLEFWFGDPPGDAVALGLQMKRWFSTDARLDTLIRERFESTLAAAASSQLDDWAETARGRLALILLLDQFPRNVYRGTASAFAQDAKALELTITGVAAGLGEHLSPLERVFFYMPMQHAESVHVHEQSVALFDELAQRTAEPLLSDALAVSADYAREHRDIIAEFGRFPHRNALLGRDSADDEARYLEHGGATFGQ